MGRILRKFNEWLADRITRVVGTMWCAYTFALISIFALPSAIRSHNIVQLVGWLSSYFLQLVLLAVILVGQDLQGRKTEARDQETHDAVMQELAILRVKHDELHAKIGNV